MALRREYIVNNPLFSSDPHLGPLLLPLMAPLRGLNSQLEQVLGPTPPLRVMVGEGPPHLTPSGSFSVPLDVGASPAGLSPEQWRSLYFYLGEGQTRWALTVRAGLSPTQLQALEGAADFSWLGFSVWACRVMSEWGGGEEEGPLPPRLVHWGRHGWRLWSQLAQARGKVATFDVALNLARLAPERAEEVASRALTLMSAEVRELALLWNLAVKEGVTPAQRGGLLPLGPVEFPSYSFQRGRVEVEEDSPVRVHVAGGQLYGWEGGWSPAQAEFSTSQELLLVATAPTTLDLRLWRQELLGNWSILGADYGSQVFGMRGVSLEFSPAGEVALALADAFLGPLTPGHVAMAGQMGVSGVGYGRWSVEGGRLHFTEISTQPVTLHSRGGRPQAFVSEEAFGPYHMLARSLSAVPWTLEPDGDTLVLRGSLGGVPAGLRLGRDLPVGDPDLPEA